MKRLIGLAAAAVGGFWLGAKRERANARRSYDASDMVGPAAEPLSNGEVPPPEPARSSPKDVSLAEQGGRTSGPDVAGQESRPRWSPESVGADHPLAMLFREHRSLLAAVGNARHASPEKPNEVKEFRAEVQRIIMDASKHEATEEAHVWPLVRDTIPDGEAVVGAAAEQELELKRILHALDSRRPGDVDFDELLESLERSLRRHIRFEETRVWPPFSFMLTRDQADGLADRLTLSASSAPTRPHPSELADPSKHPVLAKAVGLVDRGVDAVTARGRGPYSSR